MSTTPVTSAVEDGGDCRRKTAPLRHERQQRTATAPATMAAGASGSGLGSAASPVDPSVLSDLSLFEDLCKALQQRCAEDVEKEGLAAASAANTCVGTDGVCVSAAAHEAAQQWWEWRGQNSGGESTGAAFILALAAFRLADEGPSPQQKRSQRKRHHHEPHTSSGLVTAPIDLHTVRPLSLLLQQSHHKHRNLISSSGRLVLLPANSATAGGSGGGGGAATTAGETSVPNSCLYRFVGSVHAQSAHLPTVPPSPPRALSTVSTAQQCCPRLTVAIGREPSLDTSKTAVRGSQTYHRRLPRSSLGTDGDAAEKRTMPAAESQQFVHRASLALPAFAQISRQHITLSLEEFEYDETTQVSTGNNEWRVVAEDCGALNGTIAMIPETATMDCSSASPPTPPPAPSWLALRLCPRTPTVILNAQIEKPQALPRSTSSAPPALEGDNDRVAWLALAPDDPSVYVAVGLFPSRVLEAYVHHCKGGVKNRGGNGRPRGEASPQLPRPLLPAGGSAEEVVDVDREEDSEGDNVQAAHGIGSCDAGTTSTASVVPTNTTQRQPTQNTQPSGQWRRRRGEPKGGAVGAAAAAAGGSATSASLNKPSVLSPAQQIHSAIQRGADRSPAIPVVLLPPPTGNTTKTWKRKGRNNKGRSTTHNDEKEVTSATKPSPDEGADRDDADGISETAAVATSTTTHTTMAAADDTLVDTFPATTTATLLSPSISSQPQPLHNRSGAGAKRARMEEGEDDYGDNTTACSKGQGRATDHCQSDDECDTAMTATDRPRPSETTGGRAPSNRLLPHRHSAPAAAHHGRASMLCVPPSVAEWLASTCGDGTDDGTGASSLLRAPSAEHPIHILVLPTTVVATATHAHILDDRPLLRALAALGLIVVGVCGLEAAAMAGAAAKKQHRVIATTTTSTASALHQREFLDDFLVAAAAKVRYIVASASPPIADIEAGLLACLPSAAAVVQPHWLQAIMRPLEKKPQAPSSRIRDPPATASSASAAVFQFFRPGKHDLYGPVGRVLRRDRCLERDRGCSIPRLLACYRPAERRHLFVPLRFWIHPRADTMPATAMSSQFNRLSVIIRASGGTVVEAPFTGDANVLVFPSLPSPSQTTEGGGGDGGDVLGIFNWGLGGGQSDDDEDDDTDSNEEGESDDSNGASCSSPAPGSDDDDNENHRRRRRRSGASPEDTARRRRLAQRRRHTAALLPEGLSTLRTVAATCRAAVEAALRLSPQTKLRRRGLAVAFRLWVLDRVLAVQGKPLPPPMPLNLIGLTSAGSSGVGGAAAMAPVSFLNPNDVPKDASESCRVLGLCTSDDVATAILRHERALPLRTLPR